jgi:sugar phosphate isomerase/epimerase
MRLGGPIFAKHDGPASWIEAVRRTSYHAVYAPVGIEADEATVEGYAAAARKAAIVIAEAGAWSNPIEADATKARAAIEKCQRHLDLAERLGAICCVNIVGSRHPDIWDGPHPDNFSADTFDLIVATTRDIIDAVKPRRTFYTLETMPWIFPSSPDEYLDLVRAIDRPALAVHLDPVNMINSPARYFRNGDFIRECFAKLGPLIKGCHAKDSKLEPRLTVHLDECTPGEGFLDYRAYLAELAKLPSGTPLMLEHMAEEQYPVAERNIRAIAQEMRLELN